MNSFNHRTTRRGFLKNASLAGIAVWAGGRTSPLWSKSPNEKLNVAAIGTTRRGGRNIHAVARTENIVALCDVDSKRLGEAAQNHPRARAYADFRKMLEQQDIDAVLVSTPDHTHAVAAIAALQSGRHVYCEKPLAHSIYEARAMAETAKRHNLATQMGNQRHASDALRQAVEIMRDGALGKIRRAVAWSGKTQYGGLKPPRDLEPVPSYLDWDLWLGPAPERPYHSIYHPEMWRAFWDFGSGNYGDMACHIFDAPYWALDLDYPKTAEAEGPAPHPACAPQRVVVRLGFETKEGDPVQFVWYDGLAAPPDPAQEDAVAGIDLPNQGSMIVGQEGRMFFSHGGEMKLFPEEKFRDYQPPEPTLPRPADHHVEWIEACKGRGRTESDFAYGARLTEASLAGVVAYRIGQKLDWDGPNMRANNRPEAEPLIHPPMRKGWEVKI